MPPAEVDPIEPVHWGARLARTPGMRYTEVAGMPVLVRVDDADPQPLPAAWAACWASLDGRPVAEALDVDPAALDPVTARNLIEVLRRMKARGLVVDVAPDAPTPTSAFNDLSAQPGAGPIDVAVRGVVRVTPDGAVVTVPTPDRLRSASSADHFTAGERGSVIIRLDDTDGVVRATVETTPLAAIELDEPIEPLDETERCILTFAAVLDALDDRSVLTRPGCLDLLAALAELPSPTRDH